MDGGEDGIDDHDGADSAGAGMGRRGVCEGAGLEVVTVVPVMVLVRMVLATE